MSKKANMTKLRHSSLDISDVDQNKKQDMLSKAKNKLLTLSEALKHRTPDEDQHKKTITKSMTQCTLDYFFKHSHHRDKDHVYANTNNKNNNNNAPNKIPLQKQLSIGSYPIQIKISAEEDDEVFAEPINRQRPATVCVDKPSEVRNAEALALERPRKKLCFKEPEATVTKPKLSVNGYKDKDKINGNTLYINNSNGNKLKRNDTNKGYLSPLKASKNLSVSNSILHRTPSFDEAELQSQAMRIVRTVGQAFEVCHKLSINGPEHDSLVDQDEQDTLTQDLLSDRFSDIASDKPKKDLISDCASDKMSLPPDDCSFKDTYMESNHKNNRTLQLDILPPPPADHGSKKSPLSSAETYAAPHSDNLNGGGGSGSVGSGSGSLPPAGSALSAHHELQLMREQLEQQSQQTQAAMAQLQLTREQLAAEQSARLEAQARTHQLLVHNRELLDHIAALVAHLQGGDKSGQQQTPPHMTMPQQSQQSLQGEPTYKQDQYEATNSCAQLDNATLYQALGLNPQGLIENRSVASCLPSSPLRNTFNPSGGVFNFQPPPPLDTSGSFEAAQLLQRLQSLSGFSPPAAPAYVPNYSQTLPFLTQSLINQALLNNNYALPGGNKIPAQSYATLPRNFGTASFESPLSPTRKSEPRQIPVSQYQSNAIYQTQYPMPNSQSNAQPQQDQNVYSVAPQQKENRYTSQSTLQVEDSRQQRGASPRPQNVSQNTIQTPNDIRQQRATSPRTQNNSLQTQMDSRQQRAASPRPPSILDQEPRTQQRSPKMERQAQFIKPLAQIGTLTTTDSDGRVRVIVPVPSNSTDENAGNLMANLRITDDFRALNGPGITRSTSERVPNRSELMSQVQRTAWARHTTK